MAGRRLRAGFCGVVLGAVYLGLAASAMAWNEPLWVRQFGTPLDDSGTGVTTDAAGNVYLAGSTRSVECGGECPDEEGSLAKVDATGPSAGRFDAWVVKYSTRR